MFGITFSFSPDLGTASLSKAFRQFKQPKRVLVTPLLEQEGWDIKRWRAGVVAKSNNFPGPATTPRGIRFAIPLTSCS
jgi:hypothetical protein